MPACAWSTSATPIADGLITYPGLPGPVISEHLSFDDSHAVYDEGTEFTIGRIEMVSNTGTYLDTPGHRHRGRHDLSGLPLRSARCCRPSWSTRPPPAPAGIALFEGSTSPARPSWSAPAGRRTSAPSGTATRSTRSSPPTRPSGWPTHGAVLVGIDSVNIDDTRGGERPVHTLLLDREIPVVEHLTGLAQLPPTGATFSAVPAKVAGMSTFPVRAFATLP